MQKNFEKKLRGFSDKLRKVKFFNIISMGIGKSLENSVDHRPQIDIDETHRIDRYRERATFDQGSSGFTTWFSP